jgi:hypothetical protein
MKRRMLSLMTCLLVGCGVSATAQEFTDPSAWEQVIRGTGPFLDVTPSCSSLIPSGRRLDYIPGVQLGFGENSGAFPLTLPENRPGFGENNLITSGAAWIH